MDIGVIVILILVIGGIWYFASGTAKKEQEEMDRRIAEKQVEFMCNKVKAGKKLTEDDYLPYGVKKMQEDQEKKEIIKGAVVGGIIGGDAGAVVGAAMAKDKIDKQKSKK